MERVWGEYGKSMGRVSGQYVGYMGWVWEMYSYGILAASRQYVQSMDLKSGRGGRETRQITGLHVFSNRSRKKLVHFFIEFILMLYQSAVTRMRHNP